jgi:hypothetical protein
MLEERGWQWQGDFIYAPNRMLWLHRGLDFGTLEEFYERFFERLAKMKAITPKPENETVYHEVVDDNQSLSSKFNIRAIPSLLFFKNGQLRDQVTGMTSKKDLLGRIEALG